MKRFNLIFLIVLFVFLFSCAGKPKVNTAENNAQVKENVAEKPDKPAEKIDELAGEKQAPVDLAAAKEEPADAPVDTAEEKPAEEPLNEEITQTDSGKELVADAASSPVKTEPAAQEPAANTPPVSPAPSSQTQLSQAQPPLAQPPQTQPQTQPSQTQPQAQTPQPQAQTQPPQTQPSQTQPQTQPQAQAQPPQAQPQTQPSRTQPPQTQAPQTNPPAQRQQPVTPPSQTPPDEKTDATETASSDDDSQDKKEPSSYITGGSSAPATRIESLTQMGTMPYDKEIIFSRIVRATVGQIVEIPFRGNGWVYLGELTSQRGIVYSSKRNDSDGQSFIFALEESGTYPLKFYRQDFIRDYIINDHVQVVVGEAPSAGAGWFKPPAERDRVVAQPRWPSPIEETQIRGGTRPATEPVVTTATAEPAKDTASQQKAASDQETKTPQRTSPTRETNPADRTSSQNTPSSPTATGGQTAAAQVAQPAQSVQTAQSGQTAATAQTVQQGQTAATGQTTQTGQPTSVTTAEQGGGESPSAEKREKLAPEVLLQKAKESFDGGNIAAAIALLEQFKTDYPGGSDEAYWQLGQYYEANSPSRNILLSLDNYRRLVNEYPQSGRFNDARRRIAYLERYYINIQ